MRVLMIGCGNMGFAMLHSWLGSGALAVEDAAVIQPSQSGRDRVAALGVKTFATPPSPDEFAADLLVLAVKPQVMGDIASDYVPHARAGAAVMTIAAGLSLAFYERIFGAPTPIIRVMPNTPAAIGQGVMPYLDNGHAGDDLMAEVVKLLSANGMAIRLDSEEQMHSVTAISGCGPAYLFHFLEALGAAGESLGLAPDMAAALARQTVFGAAMLAKDGEETPARLREKVTSPKGVTAEGLAVMMKDDRLIAMMKEVAEAARKRSIELSQ